MREQELTTVELHHEHEQLWCRKSKNSLFSLVLYRLNMNFSVLNNGRFRATSVQNVQESVQNAAELV